MYFEPMQTSRELLVPPIQRDLVLQNGFFFDNGVFSVDLVRMNSPVSQTDWGRGAAMFLHTEGVFDYLNNMSEEVDPTYHQGIEALEDESNIYLNEVETLFSTSKYTNFYDFYQDRISNAIRARYGRYQIINMYLDVLQSRFNWLKFDFNKTKGGFDYFWFNFNASVTDHLNKFVYYDFLFHTYLKSFKTHKFLKGVWDFLFEHIEPYDGGLYDVGRFYNKDISSRRDTVWYVLSEQRGDSRFAADSYLLSYLDDITDSMLLKLKSVISSNYDYPVQYKYIAHKMPQYLARKLLENYKNGPKNTNVVLKNGRMPRHL